VTTIDPALRLLVREIFDHDTPGPVPEATGNPKLWAALAGSELPWVGIPESAGGAGGTLADAADVVRAAGAYAAALPLAETVMAGWALAASGLAVPRSPLSVVPVPGTVRATWSAGSWILDGVAQRVPWAHAVERIVALCATGDGMVVASIPTSGLDIGPGHNLAGEPRNSVTLHGVRLGAEDVVPASIDATQWQARGALVRALSMAGSLETVLELTRRYTAERVQFGRPIARFQAVQQLVVRIAEEVAVTVMANQKAVAADAAFDQVATAKCIAGEAADAASAAAHQAHGAMGLTIEYPLQLHTRRLWSYSREFGTTASWQRVIGNGVTHAGAANVWDLIVG
jgi:acyl-CoA dehydrogenase